MRAVKVTLAVVGLLGSATMIVGLTGIQQASAAPARLKCTTMQSTANSPTAPILLGGCNRPGTTGGSGTTAGQGNPTYPVLYMTGKQTNFDIVTSTFATTNRCPAPLNEFDLTGTITQVSGHYMKRYLGETIAFDVCFDSGPSIAELVPGTFFTIG